MEVLDISLLKNQNSVQKGRVWSFFTDLLNQSAALFYGFLGGYTTYLPPRFSLSIFYYIFAFVFVLAFSRIFKYWLCYLYLTIFLYVTAYRQIYQSTIFFIYADYNSNSKL